MYIINPKTGKKIKANGKTAAKLFKAHKERNIKLPRSVVTDIKKAMQGGVGVGDPDPVSDFIQGAHSSIADELYKAYLGVARMGDYKPRHNTKLGYLRNVFIGYKLVTDFEMDPQEIV